MKVSIQEVISGRIDDTKDILQKSDEKYYIVYAF